MSLLRAALVVAVVFVGASASAATTSPLRLEEAFQRVLESHPDLAVWHARRDALTAERAQAALPPAVNLGLSLENAPGTGDASEFRQAEVTLSLASVLEPAEQRRARIDVAARRFDATEAMQSIKRADLLAEVARRYLDAVLALAEDELARADEAQRTRALAAATRRVSMGGAPEPVRLSALATLQRAQGERHQAEQRHRAAKRRLSLMWSATPTENFDVAPFDFQALPNVLDLDTLRASLANNPELHLFASETRVREARLRLAHAERERAWSWQLGVRRLQDGSDWALVGQLSMPLGTAARAQPGIRAAEAELEALSFERESAQRGWEAALVEAYARIDGATTEARRLDGERLPTLERAESLAGQAFARGALTYLEWAQLQSDTLAARRERLAASAEAHRAVIELQRLTGEPLLRVDATKEPPR